MRLSAAPLYLVCLLAGWHLSGALAGLGPAFSLFEALNVFRELSPRSVSSRPQHRPNTDDGNLVVLPEEAGSGSVYLAAPNSLYEQLFAPAAVDIVASNVNNNNNNNNQVNKVVSVKSARTLELLKGSVGGQSSVAGEFVASASGHQGSQWAEATTAAAAAAPDVPRGAKKPNSQARQHSLVILVPGYGGTRLEARLDKPSVVRYFCERKSDWSDMWINVKLLLPYMIDCLIDNMRLEFDPATNGTRNTAGVEVRVKNGSHISSVEYLHDLAISSFAYYAPIADQLVESLDYQREVNLRAAPYDFRKAPNELQDYFVQLKSNTEALVESQQGRPVTFICHSMGCNNMLYFLQRQSAQWKAAHVRRLISLAAPWAGSVAALRAVALGDNLGMPYLFSESKLISVQRSLPSTIYLFPHPVVFGSRPLITSRRLIWFGEQTLFTNLTATAGHNSKPAQVSQIDGTKTSANESMPKRLAHKPLPQPQQVHTAMDYGDFFEAIEHPDGERMWQATRRLLGNLEPPGVELWCLVGNGQRTLARMDYSGDFPGSAGVEHYDTEGDGTVGLDSASYCKKWRLQQSQPIAYHEFQVAHMDIIKQPAVVEYVARIIGGLIAPPEQQH